MQSAKPESVHEQGAVLEDVEHDIFTARLTALRVRGRSGALSSRRSRGASLANWLLFRKAAFFLPQLYELSRYALGAQRGQTYACAELGSILELGNDQGRFGYLLIA